MAQEPQKRKVISKRRFPRRRFTQKIGLLISGKYKLTESIQIGEGGMLILSPVALSDGDKVIVSFMVPGRTFIIVTAQVQYKQGEVKGQMKSKGDYYGLKFLTISFDNRRKLRDFIAAKTEAEADAEALFHQ